MFAPGGRQTVYLAWLGECGRLPVRSSCVLEVILQIGLWCVSTLPLVPRALESLRIIDCLVCAERG